MIYMSLKPACWIQVCSTEGNSSYVYLMYMKRNNSDLTNQKLSVRYASEICNGKKVKNHQQECNVHDER